MIANNKELMSLETKPSFGLRTLFLWFLCTSFLLVVSGAKDINEISNDWPVLIFALHWNLTYGLVLTAAYHQVKQVRKVGPVRLLSCSGHSLNVILLLELFAELVPFWMAILGSSLGVGQEVVKWMPVVTFWVVMVALFLLYAFIVYASYSSYWRAFFVMLAASQVVSLILTVQYPEGASLKVVNDIPAYLSIALVLYAVSIILCELRGVLPQANCRETWTHWSGLGVYIARDVAVSGWMIWGWRWFTFGGDHLTT